MSETPQLNGTAEGGVLVWAAGGHGHSRACDGKGTGKARWHW